MRIVYKLSAGLLALLLLGAVIGGFLVWSSYRNVSREIYAWFDRNAANLADAISAQAKSHIASHDYGGMDAVLRERSRADENLLYASIAYGDGLLARREIGDPTRGPSRTYVRDMNEEGKPMARVTINYATDAIRRKLSSLLRMTVIGSLLTVVIATGCLFVLVRVTVNRPLVTLLERAHRAAEGDLRADAPTVTSRDEFGNLSATVNRMTENLRTMVGNVHSVFAGMEKAAEDVGRVAHAISESSREQADSVGEVSASVSEMNSSITEVAVNVDKLTTLSEGASSSILEMAASVKEVAGGAESLSAAVEQTASSIAEMDASIQGVAANVEKLTGQITDLSSSITQMDFSTKEVAHNAAEADKLSEQVARAVSVEGQEAVARAVAGIDSIRATVAEAARVIGMLGARSQDIGAIINVINEVNAQTNLLALNAAIIAAQAGEHGRSFAVVAEEIRDLSARTAGATSEITSMITGVQEQALDAVKAMEEGGRSVEEGARLIGAVSANLKKAAGDSQRATEASKIIARATSEQSINIRRISEAAQMMAQMSREISRATREQSLGGSQITRAAEEMRGLSERLKKATTDQAAGVRIINQATEETAELAQVILRTTREEAKVSEMIVRNAGNIKEAAGANQDVAQRLEEMVVTLTEQAQLLRREIDRFRVGDGKA